MARGRKGVSSNSVAEGSERGDRIRVKLRPNRHFALPAPERDIIMVGPGTGVAPFRAFVRGRGGPGGRGGRALSRVGAGAPRDRGQRPLLAVLRRPAAHARFSLSARVAGSAP